MVQQDRPAKGKILIKKNQQKWCPLDWLLVSSIRAQLQTSGAAGKIDEFEDRELQNLDEKYSS